MFYLKADSHLLHLTCAAATEVCSAEKKENFLSQQKRNCPLQLM